MTNRPDWPLRALFAALLGFAAGCALPVAFPPAWELPPPAPPEAAVVRAGDLRRFELPNGLHVLMLEDHRLPRVSVGVALRRGAALEDVSRAGLASFTAELLKRGAGERDALELAQAVDDIGAHLSAVAGWDSMGVAVSGLSGDLDRLVAILGDVVLHPSFDPGEARKARTEQRGALEKALDDPHTLVAWHTARALYGAHRYALPLDGTLESVGSLDAAAARDFHRRVFVPGNAVLYAVGDLDAADWERRVRADFGAGRWRAAAIPPAPPAPPEPAPESRLVVVVDRPDLAQSQISVAHGGIRRSDPDRIPADLVNKVLGGSGFASRLMQRVRADEGLTYGVGSGFSLRREPGPFRISTSTRASETRRVIDLLLEEMRRIVTDPPSPDELARAKSLAVGRFGLGLETSGAVLSSLVELDVAGLPDDALDTYRSRVRAVTSARAAAVAQRLFHPERAAIVMLGPAAQIVPQLEGLGPLEVVTP